MKTRPVLGLVFRLALVLSLFFFVGQLLGSGPAWAKGAARPRTGKAAAAKARPRVLPPAGPAAVKPIWPQLQSDLPADPAVIYGVLPNGFRYVLMRNTEPKERVAVFLDVQAGSLYETDRQQGVAHYLEHMMFNGTNHYAPDEMIRYFQSIGMAYGPDVNAHTGFDETVYNVILPDGTEKHLTDGFTVIADYAAGALLLPSEINRERGVILAEKKERDSVSYRTFLATMNFLLPGTLASTRMPIGKEEVIKRADKPLLTGFYDRWYRPEKMVLVAVGDFEPETAAVLVKRIFSGLAPRAPRAPDPFPGRVSHRGDHFFYHHEKEAGNTEAVIETVQQIPERPDSLALETEYMYRDMANAVVQNRLDRMKESADCPFTAAYMTSGIFLKTISFTNITAKTSPENWKKSLLLMDETLRRALLYGFSADEVERVKKDWAAALDARVLKAPTRDSTALAGEIIGQLNDDKVFTSPKDDLRLYGPVVAAATPKMLWEALKRSWSPNNRMVQLTGNAVLPGGKKDLRAAYLAAKKRRIGPPKKEAAAVFPFLPDPPDSDCVEKRELLADIGVTRLVLRNGVRVNLKPTDFKKGEILFTLRFGGGRADCPKDKPGLASLAPAVINDSGVGPLTLEALNEALAGKNIGVGFGIGEDSFSLSGSSVPKDLPSAFQLLYARLLAPAFRRDAYEKARERFAQGYAALSHETEGVLQLSGLRFLASGDNRFGLPAPADFMKLTLSDVSDWLTPALSKEPLELSVVGDFDPETVIALVRRYFGSLPPRAGLSTPPRDRGLAFPRGGEHAVTVETKIGTGLVMVAYPTADVWDIRRTRRLAVLADVFADRIRTRIREKMGVTYSPDAWNMGSRAYKGYGYLGALVTVDAPLARKVVDEVNAIARDLASKGVTPDELTRAVAPSVTNVKEVLRTNTYWLGTVLSGSTAHPEQLDWCRTILSDYSSITVDDVNKVAAEYLAPDKAAVILALPSFQVEAQAPAAQPPQKPATAPEQPAQPEKPAAQPAKGEAP